MSCCKNCTKRSVTCHVNCPEYKREVDKLRKEKEARKEQYYRPKIWDKMYGQK